MSPRIRLRDLRYYTYTGLIFGGINGLVAFGPDLIKSFWIDGLTQLGYNGPLVPYWVEDLIQFPIGVVLFALIGALPALLVGYFQFWRKLARLENLRHPEAQAPQAQLPRS
ncbi:MAG: hypothetical protein ACREXS_19975 [Gammaproteobacteria bacterium]